MKRRQEEMFKEEKSIKGGAHEAVLWESIK